MNLLNVDDSHLPADEKYLPTLYLLVWVRVPPSRPAAQPLAQS